MPELNTSADMKRILGLDLGTTSIGWAVVNEAEEKTEKSSIIDMGVRIVPLSTDEKEQFDKGKAIETNTVRRQKRSMRRNLQRYKLRRKKLIETMVDNGIIESDTILYEDGPGSTFNTHRMRARAATEKIGLDDFARVLLMINKKRGYKSNRKAKNKEEDGAFLDGMDLARLMQKEGLTPGEVSLGILEGGKTKLPAFYPSDLKAEFSRIWHAQARYYPDALTDELFDEIIGKTSRQTWAILSAKARWSSTEKVWNQDRGRSEEIVVEHSLKGLKRNTKGREQKIENYRWRVEALNSRIDFEQLAVVLQDINSQISAASGYLGAISDRSKQLFFENFTVGQYLWEIISGTPGKPIKGLVFYRQDYIDEFNTVWDKQAEFYPEILTPELKRFVRDRIIFYQRPLKSQKDRISICELEQREMAVEKNGKPATTVVGRRVIPRSHPLFQEFRIWQTLNNIEVFYKDRRRKKGSKLKGEMSLFDDSADLLQVRGSRPLCLEEKQLLAEELSVKDKLTKKEILKLLFEDYRDLDLNYDKIEGNHTGHALYRAFSEIAEACSGAEPVDFRRSAAEIKARLGEIFSAVDVSTDILDVAIGATNQEIEGSEYYRLWHLLYSYEGDNTPTGYGKLLDILSERYHIPGDCVSALAQVVFDDEYGNLSAKAISKILPFMKEGNTYDVACAYAGYNHSRRSLTSEQNQQRPLKPELELLPKNSLRNPVVEKILNQMVNVVNALSRRYGIDGHFDEIRVEMARDLKRNASQREKASKQIAEATKANNDIRDLLKKEFGIAHVSRNDILRYKLYMELEPNGFKTLYSNQYIPRETLFSKEIDIEHIIPKAKQFDDSMSNKTLEYRAVNEEKGSMTAYDYMKAKTDKAGLEGYISRCEKVFADKKGKLKKLLTSEGEIPEGFIARDLKNTQYIAKKAMEMLLGVCRSVYPTVGEITNKLREEWQLVDIMKEINLPKYSDLGMVETYKDHDGRTIRRISDWSKRNDHRHHAMDALTVAFTRLAFVQYYNNQSAQFHDGSPEKSNIIALRAKYFPNGTATPPMPLGELRAQARNHLERILVSVKAKNKVVTPSVNRIATRKGTVERVQLTPRGELHNETLYGVRQRYVTKEEKINATFDEAKIATVCSAVYREALSKRLLQFGGDPKKAFTGKNSPSKNPIFLPGSPSVALPEKVRTVTLESYVAKRAPVDDRLKIDAVVDAAVRRLLAQRLADFGGDPKKAFVNLDKNPIIFNGRPLKRVTIKTNVSGATPIHFKRDRSGKVMPGVDAEKRSVDFVQNGANHMVALFRRPKTDKKGDLALDTSGNPIYEWKEEVISFMEAVQCAISSLPILDSDRHLEEGWELYMTLKKNEYVVIPDPDRNFRPAEINLLDPANAALISPRLFRVQKLSSRDYYFRHHLETTVEENRALHGTAWIRIQSLQKMDGVVKVRVDHTGRIVEANLK